MYVKVRIIDAIPLLINGVEFAGSGLTMKLTPAMAEELIFQLKAKLDAENIAAIVEAQFDNISIL